MAEIDELTEKYGELGGRAGQTISRQMQEIKDLKAENERLREDLDGYDAVEI